jgi:hypothetical protein
MAFLPLEGGWRCQKQGKRVPSRAGVWTDLPHRGAVGGLAIDRMVCVDNVHT